MVENDSFMKYIHPKLYDNRFRSKASSAGHLSPDYLELSDAVDSFFLALIDATQSG